ncbi:MAG: tetratricopeptide repeat protein [Fibrobacterota bacterium]
MTRFSGLTRQITLLAAVILLWAGSALSADEDVSVFKLGERFFNDSLYNLAIEQYQKYISLPGRTPDNDPPAYFKIALSYYRMENLRKAAESFEEYIKLFPSESNIMDAMFYAGEARQKLKDYKEASELFYGVWSRFVGSARAQIALFEAASCAEMAGDNERAVELYGIYYARFPEQSKGREAAIALIRIHIEQQDFVDAKKVLNEAEKRWKKEKQILVRLYYYRGLLHQTMLQPQKAVEMYQAMLQEGEEDFQEISEAYRQFTRLLIQQDDFINALPLFERRAEWYKKAGDDLPRTFLIDWAETARKARQFDSAESLYKQLLDTHEDSANRAEINYRLAECQVGNDKFSEAIETLQQLEALDPDGEYGVNAVKKIGDLYFSKSLYPSAIAAYRRFLQLPGQENKDLVLYRIAKIYQEIYQRYGAAIREFENLLKWYPSSIYYSRSVFAIAQCYEAVEEYGAAIRQYDFLIESGGDQALAEKTRERIDYLKQFRIKDPEAAAYQLTRFIEKPSSEISQFQRLQTAASIFEKHLKDFTKSLELYDRLESIAQGNDSLISQVSLSKAGVYHKMWQKAVCESDSQTAQFSKKKAIALYQSALDMPANNSAKQEAAFNLLMLSDPNIGEYETFVKHYPDSRHIPEVLLTIAEHYEQRAAAAGDRFSEKAVDAYRRIVTSYPSDENSSRALIGLATNYSRLDEYDSVNAVLDTFISRFPSAEQEPQAYFLKGTIAGKQNDHQQAVEVFKQVLYRYPFSQYAQKARLELAFSELATGKVFDALNNFRVSQQNISDETDRIRAQYGIGKCMVRLGKSKKAQSIYSELLSLDMPGYISADIQRDLATIAMENNDSFGALNHLKKVLSYDSYPQRYDVLKQMGKLYFDNRMYEDAVGSYKQAFSLSGTAADSSELLTRLVCALTMNGESRKSDKYQKMFKDRFGTDSEKLAEMIYYDGVYLLVEKKYDKAVKRFKYIETKFAKSKRADDAAYQIALAHYYGGDKEKSLKLFHEYATRYPQSQYVPLAYFKLGMIFHTDDEFAQAADYFEKAVKHPKTDSQTGYRSAHNAAVAYQKISSWLDAARMYKVLLKDYSDKLSDSHLNLKIGFCLIQASRVEQALDHFEEANKNPSPEDKPELIYWIGTCYSKLGEYQRAISEYLKVPYLYSGMGKWGVTAEFEAARLYERQGEYSKATNLYKKIVRSDGERGHFGKKALERVRRLSNLVEN